MVHECVPIGASIRASRASWDYSRASAQLCRSQQQHGLGVERAYTSRISTQYKTIPRRLSTEAIQAVVYASAKIHKRPARVPLPQLHMCAHSYRQLTPQYDARVHTVSHMFFAGAIKLANTSPNTCRSSGPLAFKSRLQIQPSLSIAISSR
jgi:hypothetical protein